MPSEQPKPPPPWKVIIMIAGSDLPDDHKKAAIEKLLK
jgi:hypothetical protein